MVMGIISPVVHTNLTIVLKTAGTSYRDVYGCPDFDNDGTSDTTDPCPYDPEIFEENRIIVYEITEPQQDGESESESASSSTQPTLIYIESQYWFYFQ